MHTVIQIANTVDRLLTFFTSRKAIALYRNTWQTLVFLWNLFLLLCAVAILAGSLTRDLWEAFCNLADRYVESCTYHPVAVTLALPEAAAPIGLLPPAKDRQRPIIAPWTEDRVIVTPAPKPVYMDASTQPAKRKRGRPKKAA